MGKKKKVRRLEIDRLSKHEGKQCEYEMQMGFAVLLFANVLTGRAMSSLFLGLVHISSRFSFFSFGLSIKVISDL